MSQGPAPPHSEQQGRVTDLFSLIWHHKTGQQPSLSESQAPDLGWGELQVLGCTQGASRAGAGSGQGPSSREAATLPARQLLSP